MSGKLGGAPVTVLITRRVRPGRAAEFEELMDGMQAAARRFRGHLGGHLITPGDSGSGCYHVIFAFDREAHLHAWSESAERRAWLEKMARVTFGENSTRILTGLEGWFALPSRETRRPPSRHKMALVTWLGIFPLVMALSALLGPLLSPIHPALSVLVVTALVVIFMTWAVMPVLTRAFAWWLYPNAVPQKTG